MGVVEIDGGGAYLIATIINALHIYRYDKKGRKIGDAVVDTGDFHVYSFICCKLPDNKCLLVCSIHKGQSGDDREIRGAVFDLP